MTDKACPCGRGRDYEQCCGPLHTNKSVATTAEQLMRSRYSAYVKGRFSYLRDTTHKTERKEFNIKATKAWCAQIIWTGLKISNRTGGSPTEVEGIITFKATYIENDTPKELHEISLFKKEAGRWYYVKPLQD